MVDSTKPRPHLLSIPSELRNRIYGYALLEPKGITISPGNTQQQPAILRTCRQIRREAIGIYYSDNNFRVTVCWHDGCKLLPLRRLLLKYRAKGVHKNYSIRLWGWIGTDDLDAWLKEYYHDPVTVPSLRQDAPAEETRAYTLARRTFGVVNRRCEVGRGNRSLVCCRPSTTPSMYSSKTGRSTNSTMMTLKRKTASLQGPTSTLRRLRRQISRRMHQKRVELPSRGSEVHEIRSLTDEWYAGGGALSEVLVFFFEEAD